MTYPHDPIGDNSSMFIVLICTCFCTFLNLWTLFQYFFVILYGCVLLLYMFVFVLCCTDFVLLVFGTIVYFCVLFISFCTFLKLVCIVYFVVLLLSFLSRYTHDPIGDNYNAAYMHKLAKPKRKNKKALQQLAESKEKQKRSNN